MESTVAINPTRDRTIPLSQKGARAFLLTEICFFSLQCVSADQFEQQGRS